MESNAVEVLKVAMKIWQSRKILAAILSCLASFPFAQADETVEDIDASTSQYLKLSKDQYESEVLKLETWKSNVRGTQLGERLMRDLTTLDANLVRNPRDKQSLYHRGYLYGTVGCTRAAIADLSKAIQVDSLSANLYSERALCFMDLGEYLRAQSDLNMAIYLNPFSGDAHLARGRLLLILNKPELALSDLLLCKEHNQEFVPVLPGELPGNHYGAPDYYIGVCYELLGKHDLAIQSFLRSTRDMNGSENGYIHRYADRPLDAAERAERLQSS